LHMLSKCSTSSAMAPALLYFDFSKVGSCCVTRGNLELLSSGNNRTPPSASASQVARTTGALPKCRGLKYTLSVPILICFLSVLILKGKMYS
jgi:hypothetical protein